MKRVCCELLSNLYLYIVVDNGLSVFNSISIGCKYFRKIKNDCLLRKSLTGVGLFFVELVFFVHTAFGWCGE